MHELDIVCSMSLVSLDNLVIIRGEARPKEGGMAERILPTKAEPQAPAPTTHLYNDPSLSATEFLIAVMRDTHLPMVARIAAASALLPFTHPAPRSVVQGCVPYHCKIIIGGLGPAPTENHSQNPDFASKTVTHGDDTVAPLNIERDPEPSFVPDYSTPPTATELQEIKAAINRLRPDLAELRSSQPEPHLCPCGHWIVGDCGCPPLYSSRDPSKMN
jgi:hypothetical protein